MTDSYLYAIIPSILLFISESLPFIPNKYNGISHLIYHILKDIYEDTKKKSIPDASDSTTQTDNITQTDNTTLTDKTFTIRKKQTESSVQPVKEFKQTDTKFMKQKFNVKPLRIPPLSTTSVSSSVVLDDDFEHINKDSYV